MRVASLGSGSRGNGTLIEDGDTCLLVDLGFSVKETLARLARLSRSPDDIDAILVTHEHADHINGVVSFAAANDVQVRMTPGTEHRANLQDKIEVARFSSHQPFSIGSIHIEPVPVPHDAREPSQFVFTARDEKRIGILTDIGHVTPHVRERYHSCDALLLECNHDVEMLVKGPYPQRLKQRVAGIQGHLSNAQAADLLRSVKTDRLSHVVLNHISERNNLPSLALAAAREALGEWHGDLQVADQQNGIDWIEIA